MTDRELMQQALEGIDWLRHHLTQHHGCLHMAPTASGIPAWLNRTESDLRERLAQPDEWKSLSFFDKTLLRTTHAPLKPVYYDRAHDRSVCAEVVNDWDNFFTDIESKLREKNA